MEPALKRLERAESTNRIAPAAIECARRWRDSDRSITHQASQRAANHSIRYAVMASTSAIHFHHRL